MCLCTCKSARVCAKACELVYIGACELGNRVGHYAWLFFSDKTRLFVQMEKLAKNPTDYRNAFCPRGQAFIEEWSEVRPRSNPIKEIWA